MSKKGTLCHATTRWETVLWGEGGGEGRGERFGGEGESLWCVFEWKYMMYCVSL